MNKTFNIMILVLSILNAGLCIMSENWAGVCGWVVAATSQAELLEK